MKLTKLLIFLLVLLTFPYMSASQCQFSQIGPPGPIGISGTLFSENNQYKVKIRPLFLSKSPPLRAVLTDKNGDAVEFELVDGKYPADAVLLNDGRLLTLGIECRYQEASDNKLRMYSQEGKLLWQKSVIDILPELPGLYQIRHGNYSWISGIKLESVNLKNNNFVRFSLRNKDQLNLYLSDGTTEHIKIPFENLLIDPDEAFARVIFNSMSPRYTPPSKNMLEQIHKKFPSHIESATTLVKLHGEEKNYKEILKIYQRLQNIYPVDINSEVSETSHLSYGKPLWHQGNIAFHYLKLGQFEKAKPLFEQIYKLRPNNFNSAVAYADALFNLKMDSQALSVINQIFSNRLAQIMETNKHISFFHTELSSIITLLDKHEHQASVQKYLDILDDLHTSSTDLNDLLDKAKLYFKHDYIKRAIRDYRAVARKSELNKAELILAKIYFDGDKVEQDLEQAFFWYAKAGEKNKVPYDTYNNPLFALCHFYRQPDPFPNDPDTAFKWCKLSVDEGENKALFWLAMHYGDKNGNHYDPRKSMDFLEKAEKVNEPKFRSGRLASSYPSNTILRKDFEWASKILNSGEHKNTALSQVLLGRMYLYGDSIDKNLDQAEIHLLKAKVLGHPKATHYINQLQRIKYKNKQK